MERWILFFRFVCVQHESSVQIGVFLQNAQKDIHLKIELEFWMKTIKIREQVKSDQSLAIKTTGNVLNKMYILRIHN